MKELVKSPRLALIEVADGRALGWFGQERKHVDLAAIGRRELAPVPRYDRNPGHCAGAFPKESVDAYEVG